MRNSSIRVEINEGKKNQRWFWAARDNKNKFRAGPSGRGFDSYNAAEKDWQDFTGQITAPFQETIKQQKKIIDNQFGVIEELKTTRRVSRVKPVLTFTGIAAIMAVAALLVLIRLFG